jgi:hypothetical protein
MFQIQRSIGLLLLYILLLFLNPLTSLGDSGFVLWVKGSSTLIKEAWHIHGTYDTLKTCTEARRAAFQEALVSVKSQKSRNARDMELSINHEETLYVTSERIGRVDHVTSISFHCFRDSENPRQ